MKICSFRLLVKPDPLEQKLKTESGFTLDVVRTRTDERRERAAQTTGILLQVGKTAWNGYDDGAAWAEVGDRVLYTRYGGKYITDPEDLDNDLIIIDDENVLAVLEAGEEYKN